VHRCTGIAAAPHALLAHACRYDLVSIVVHHGHSVSSGHYVAYVKSASGVWHLCDDQCVCRVKPDCVFKQQAYILMYSRRTARSWLLPHRAGGGGPAAATLGPTLRAGVPTRAMSAAAQGGLRGGDAEAALVPSGTPHSDDSFRGTRATTSRPAAVAALPVAGVSPRNSRIPRAMARNLGLNGRSAKNLNLLQASYMSTRKRLMVRQVLNHHIDEVQLQNAASPVPALQYHASCAEHRHSSPDGAAVAERSGGTVVRVVPGVDLLLRAPGQRQVAAIGTWEDVDKGAAQLAQSPVVAACTKRSVPDEYDEAYDRGRVKRVRQKRAEGVGAVSLQAAQETRAAGVGIKAPGRGGQARFAGNRRQGRIGGMRSVGGPGSG
jgi:hypothetical protein